MAVETPGLDLSPTAPPTQDEIDDQMTTAGCAAPGATKELSADVAPPTSGIDSTVASTSTDIEQAGSDFAAPAKPPAAPPPGMTPFDLLESTTLGMDDNAARNHIHTRDTPTDPTTADKAQIAVMQGQRQQHIRDLYNAIVDIDNARDNATCEAFKAFRDQAYEPDDILAGCSYLWSEVVAGAKKGWRIPFSMTAQLRKAIAASVKAGRYTGDVTARFTKIVGALRQEKTLCVSVIDIDLTQMRSLIYAPTESMEVKNHVRTTNNKRAAKQSAKQSGASRSKGKSAADTSSATASALQPITPAPFGGTASGIPIAALLNPGHNSYASVRAGRFQSIASAPPKPGAWTGCSSRAPPFSSDHLQPAGPLGYRIPPGHSQNIPSMAPGVARMGYGVSSFPADCPSTHTTLPSYAMDAPPLQHSIQQTPIPKIGQIYPISQFQKRACLVSDDDYASQDSSRSRKTHRLDDYSLPNWSLNVPAGLFLTSESQQNHAPVLAPTLPRSHVEKRRRLRDDDGEASSDTPRSRKTARTDDGTNASLAPGPDPDLLSTTKSPGAKNIRENEPPSQFHSAPAYVAAPTQLRRGLLNAPEVPSAFEPARFSPADFPTATVPPSAPSQTSPADLVDDALIDSRHNDDIFGE
ncbi:hypothetical protein K490DRAFT_69785 [Saccharata proteae CBS 121410]|uniref:Uncharacterized protein n=1 Tax=Saccharata proteae CBS 121410 TaxID=1314787 RepID=A0A9P4LRE3_9PEZI|nr:hypothetical protein K490DRAFT_69785 [Saccharata proteae CBS 121410]